VWDLALKRSVPWVWDRTATVASLGLSIIRNVPYQDAARGSPNDGVLFLVSLGVAYLFGSAMARIAPLQVWRVPEAVTPEAKVLAATYRKRIESVVTIAIFVFLIFQIGQIRLTYKLTDDFSHNISALTPLVEPREAASFRVAFTHMQTREDHLRLVAAMKDRAKAVGIELPR
jgi:hypothetical protein